MRFSICGIQLQVSLFSSYFPRIWISRWHYVRAPLSHQQNRAFPPPPCWLDSSLTCCGKGGGTPCSRPPNGVLGPITKFKKHIHNLWPFLGKFIKQKMYVYSLQNRVLREGYKDGNLSVCVVPVGTIPPSLPPSRVGQNGQLGGETACRVFIFSILNPSSQVYIHYKQSASVL